MSNESNTNTSGKLLVIDDEPVAVKNLVYALKKEGHEVHAADSGPSGLRALQQEYFDVVLTDLRMERVDGMEILRYCREHYPESAVIVITGYATVSTAVDAIKDGAFELHKISLIRTIILSLSTILIAWLSNRQKLHELSYLVYPLIIITGIKLIIKDLGNGTAITLFVGFVIYGFALILAPKIKLKSSKNKN